jgi:hypothetical protein
MVRHPSGRAAGQQTQKPEEIGQGRKFLEIFRVTFPASFGIFLVMLGRTARAARNGKDKSPFALRRTETIMPNRTRASSGKVASNPDRPADISGGANASAKHPTHSAPPESHQGTSKKVGGEGQRRHSPNGRGR